MDRLKHIIKLLFTTIAFLSWLPVPHWTATNRNLHWMGVFFPIAGALFGGLAALVLFVSLRFFPYTVAVALTLLCYGWITGAFHEDALVDVADGMGGCEPKKILEIMHDSRVGAYGLFALISAYVLRFAALVSIAPEMAMRNLIAYAAVSRMAGVFFLTLAQPGDIPPESLGRTVSFSNQWGLCLLSMLIAGIVVHIVVPFNMVFILSIVVGVPIAARRYFLGRIGHITGDCAGFTIYVVETILHVLATAKT